jgi:hypothetical protein
MQEAQHPRRTAMAALIASKMERLLDLSRAGVFTEMGENLVPALAA